MTTDLRHLIAQQLCRHSTGLLLKELAEKLPPETYDNNRDKISLTLNSMLKSDVVDKGKLSPARWSITAQGRAYYSELNQDDDYEKTTADTTKTQKTIVYDKNQETGIHASMALAEDHPAVPAFLLDAEPGNQNRQSNARSETLPDYGATVDDWHDAVMRESERRDQALLLDPAYEVDAIVINPVETIHRATQPITILDKLGALDLLDECQNNTMFSGPTRATFARIRQAVEQMEEAE